MVNFLLTIRLTQSILKRKFPSVDKPLPPPPECRPLKKGLKMNISPGANFRNFTVFFCSVYNFPLVLLFSSCSVGCLWHSHSKNLVRLYPKLQSQPIGLPKIFIDYFFFQVDQWDCTKPLSICD